MTIVPDRAYAEELIRALTGGDSPDPEEFLVYTTEAGWVFRAPDYAGIKVDLNSTVTVIPLVNSWVLITVFNANSPYRTSTPDQANDSVLIGATGDYEVGFNADISGAAASKVAELNIFEIGETQKTITGATAADPVVVTAVAHGFSDGDKVKHSGIVGMVELNDRIFTIQDSAADTYELTDDGGASPANDIDGTGFAAYVSGGIAQLATQLDIHGHRKYAAGGDIGSGGDAFYASLTYNNSLQAAMKNVTDANNFTVEHMSLRLKRVD